MRARIDLDLDLEHLQLDWMLAVPAVDALVLHCHPKDGKMPSISKEAENVRAPAAQCESGDDALMSHDDEMYVQCMCSVIYVCYVWSVIERTPVPQACGCVTLKYPQIPRDRVWAAAAAPIYYMAWHGVPSQGPFS